MAAYFSSRWLDGKPEKMPLLQPKKIVPHGPRRTRPRSAHLGLLKAKLAKLKRELITPKGGFPSVGKSTLLSNLAGVYSEVAAYEFTTLTTVPGSIKFKGAKIQLLDLSGIIEGAKDGKFCDLCTI
ncbi:hypothetical protein HAZT_HAZT000020 [Hyalella azteca]|uniref:G domain-containing protein n=1 Tax=Hyalella azteca TaxID=294128 RepID=A0A6A0H3J1_HYAAZ|nr:hypothetical protein HAZT_HAZT000020 [Hyalella azteca]